MITLAETDGEHIDLNKYRIPADTKVVDSIIESDLIDNPDFNDPENLTKEIEHRTKKFIEDIMTILTGKSK